MIHEKGNNIMEPMLASLGKILGYLAAPIIGLFAWIGKRLHVRLDVLEAKVNELDKTHAVQQAQLADLKEDIESIDKKLDKILDKLTNAA